MPSRPAFKFSLVLVILFLLLAACTPEGESLTLVDYANPEGLYKLRIPKDWTAEYDELARVVQLRPPDAKGTEGELQVHILVMPVSSLDTDTRLEEIKTYFQPFLDALIDADQEVFNRGETTVDRMNAVLLDFGRPWQNSYLVGREVLVNSSAYAIAFVGLGEDTAWKAFLPTFRKVLASFQLSYAEPTLLPGGFKP
jgi:hypothetical protein